LYKYAREGKANEAEIKKRQIEISAFNLRKIDLPLVDFELHCSKGTYVRSLAHDFGKALNNGAFLSSLRRTKIGAFDVAEAWVLDDFIKFLDFNF
ncbi:MAG: tRNA pseudouridine(55) synthase, partial [Bacteroidota bacterium]